MANANDALGLAAERIADNARQTSLATQISAYSGDANGLKDLQIKQADVHDRLNLSSTGAAGSALAYCNFGVGAVST